MTTYLFELPTTGAISFSEFCVDQGSRESYDMHIARCTEVRASLRGALKENKRTRDEKDYLSLVKILDEYIPLLSGLIESVAHDEIGLKVDPVFSWRTTLSASAFNQSPRLNVPSLHADYAFSLLTYAFALSNLARSNVATLGSYEHDRTISDAALRSKDERLKHAVTFLCRASGIYAFIAESVLPAWERSKDAAQTKPPDLSRDVANALAKMSLADAQTLAIRKLLSKSAYDSNVAPGPPLPKSHPSPALVAKFHLECASLYSSARSLVKGDPNGEVVPQLRHYLADEASFHFALARKWLGVDAGENGGSSAGGDAVAFMTWAKKGLEELKDGKSGMSIRDTGRSSRKEKVAEELVSVTAWLKHYKKVNDTLHFCPVPDQASLQARMPAGRLAVVTKEYVPVTPSFGPGSIEFLRRRTEEIGTTPPAKDYAGSGSYF